MSSIFARRALVACAMLLAPRRADAQLEVRSIVQTLTQARPIARSPAVLSAGDLPRWLARPSSQRVSILVELPRGVDAKKRGLLPIVGGFAAGEPRSSELSELLSNNADARVTWSPPRYPLMNSARAWVRADAFRNQTAGTGKGVVIGIVDTGIDAAHADLRLPNGKTRVRWLIDFSRPAAGRQAELEAEYGCTSLGECAVFSNDDLDELIDNPIARDEPQDSFGHGTHVASLAAGNGLSQSGAPYAGIAPEATLIIARVSRSGGGAIYDADILRATRFIFEQASRLGLPAVVNLSLGSDFGAHDGSAPIERALAEFVGAAEPSRAIVVAAGNSAGLFSGNDTNYPQPFGTHTEVHVPRDSTTRVPLLIPSSSRQSIRGTLWIWIATRREDRISIGVDDEDERLVDPLASGSSDSYKRGELTITILNRVAAAEDANIATGEHGAVVIFDGSFKSGSVYALRLQGHGTARMWVQSEGELGPDSGSVGALFPKASKAGTINIPASHPELIAVGATLNRLEWDAHTGKNHVRISSHGALTDPPLDSVAYFSSAGPTATGWIKPDIVAPGAYVIGAMARLADPRLNGGTGIFAGQGRCDEFGEGVECFVVDAFHAISSGTSMAAPLVAGAVALLLERDPTLTQPDVLRLLQAGARRPDGAVLYEQQLGPGELDLTGALAVQTAGETSIVRNPVREASWLSLADDFIRPDPNWPLLGLLELRDGSGAIATGFAAERLELEASPAVGQVLTPVAPGMWRIEVRARGGTGGQSLKLRVTFDRAVVAERVLPIAVDRSLASDGMQARGGCTLVPRRSANALSGAALYTLLALALARLTRRRRRQSSNAIQSLAR